MPIDPNSAGNLGPQDLALLMRQAGFPASEVETGVGVALAESGGNPRAHNSTPPDDSYGLWQINMLGSLGPARRKRFGISKNEELFTPEVNAKAAYIVWKESGWNAWTTYTSGKYKESIGGDIKDGLGDLADGVKKLNPITGIADSVNNFGQTLSKAFVNIGGIMVGLAVLAAGFILIVVSDKKVIDTAKKGAKVAAKTVVK